MNQKTIAIVGGGQAAAMAAAALRQQGFDGELHLFSDEQHQPYERPPLSKAMLLDDNPQLQPILPADWWREHNVQLHLGVTVQTLGRQTHQLVLADGQSYPWDRLLIATGAAARPLPLLDKLGDRCFTLRHQQAGVRVLLNSAIEHAEAGECLSLMLQNGETLLADVMVYGIGIVANDTLAREAGLETANGIIVDSACTTAAPDIFAAGDVAITRKPDGSLVRMESWENANFQAQIAAAAMLNLPLPEKTPDWFWTDQFNDHLQFVGEMQGESWFIRGNSDAHKAIWFNLQNGVIVGAVTLNQGREIRLLRKWIQAKKKPPMAALVDETILLKSI